MTMGSKPTIKVTAEERSSSRRNSNDVQMNKSHQRSRSGDRGPNSGGSRKSSMVSDSNSMASVKHFNSHNGPSESHIYHEMEEPQENSMLASIRPNLHLRRKSMPAITGLDTFALSRIAESAAAASEAEAATSSTQVKKRQSHSQLFVTESIANRRLSSPPALEKDVFYFNHMAQAYTKQHHKNHRKNRQSYDDCWDQDQAGSGSSSTGSLQKLNISGLNPSSSDMRVNTVISGHQNIGTLFGPNSMTHPESISINMLNAPGDSTVQCDCGHINCPLCNLMMNLELTDPTRLM